jgi:hypothetical protein
VAKVFCNHDETTSACYICHQTLCIFLFLYKMPMLETMQNVHVNMETRTMSQHCDLLHQPLSECFMQSTKYYLAVYICVVDKPPITFSLTSLQTINRRTLVSYTLENYLLSRSGWHFT